MPDQVGGAERRRWARGSGNVRQGRDNCDTGKFAVMGGSTYGVSADWRATPSRIWSDREITLGPNWETNPSESESQ